MEEKEVDYSTIRIKNSLRLELDSLKVEFESYSVVIARLLEENKRLKEYVEDLKADKDKLFKIALSDKDSAGAKLIDLRSRFFFNL